jgi:hypothetical protein
MTTEESPTPFLIPTPDPQVFDLHVDNSSKELFETCARAAEYYTVYRREGKAERAALFRGTVIHKALAQRKLWRPNITDKQFEPEQMAVILNAYMDKDFGPDEWRTAEHAINTIIAYNKHWPIESEPFTVVEGTVEMPFRLLLGTANLDTEVQTHAGKFYVKDVNIYWTGIVDSIVDYGVPLVMDHKTTSILGPTFFDDFVLSSQMMGYVWAANKLGHHTVGLLLDAIAGRKPTKTGVAVEFQRQRYFYSPEHLMEWEKDTFTLITDFLEHLCRAYFPKTTKWCFGKYGRCQYWDICSQQPDHRAAMLHSDLYKPVTWTPLNPTPTL